MNRIFQIGILMVVSAFLFACSSGKPAYKKELTAGGYKAVIESDQPPHVGINKWKIKIYKPDSKLMTGAKVSVNGYMPPMPGMPEMSFDYPVVDKGSYYEADVNLSMAGTWQITIKAEKGNEQAVFKFGFNL